MVKREALLAAMLYRRKVTKYVYVVMVETSHGNISLVTVDLLQS